VRRAQPPVGCGLAAPPAAGAAAVNAPVLHLGGDGIRQLPKLVDELGRRLIEVESKKDKDCPICGTSGVEGLGDEVAPALAPRVREEWGGVPPADVHTKGDFRCQS